MINPGLLPKQPKIYVSYWNVGSLLHCSVLLFVLESLFYWSKLKDAYNEDAMGFILFWFGSLLFAFSHIFLVTLDAWSRFQNYKRVKDYFYMHGFTPKVASRYKGSKCQRTAVIVAANELGLQNEVQRYYHRVGVRWFHFVPQFMVNDSLFLFKRYFWSRTFMEKYYAPKFNFKELTSEISV